MAVAEWASRGRTVAVHVENDDDRVVTVSITVADVGDDSHEIRDGDRVIGFIHRAGRIFVALQGSRLDRAEECGQSPLWDHAAARLIIGAGLLEEHAETEESACPGRPDIDAIDAMGGFRSDRARRAVARGGAPRPAQRRESLTPRRSA